MKIKATSVYKDPVKAKAFLGDWNYRIQSLNNSFCKKIHVQTSLGKTVLWGYNTDKNDLDTIIIFPGFRTCGMFWDLGDGLYPLKKISGFFLPISMVSHA